MGRKKQSDRQMIFELVNQMPEYEEGQVYVEYTDKYNYLYVVAKERVGRKEKLFIRVFSTQVISSSKQIILNALQEIGYMSIEEYDNKYRNKHILLNRGLDNIKF